MKQINTYINEKLRLTTKHTYTCQAEDRYELRQIIQQRIKDEGPNCDLNDIDISKIKDMSYLFDARDYTIFKDFNGDISLWDVSNVKRMMCMFHSCKKFNCDISRWNVLNVDNIGWMFYGCEHFNCDLSLWNVSNVKFMEYAFFNCPAQPDWYDKERWE